MSEKIFRALVACIIMYGSSSHGHERFSIGIVQHNVFIDMYQLTYEHALIAELEKHAFLDPILKDSEGDLIKQKQQIRDLIKRKVDIIIVWPVHGEEIIEVLEEAYHAGIPIVITNSNVHKKGYPFVTAFSGPNNELEGEIAAEILCQRLKDLGKNDDAKVVEIAGLKGYTTSFERSAGFNKKFSEICPNSTVLERQFGNWDRQSGYSIMQDYLKKYPKIDGVFSADDNMGVGALEAAKSQSKHEKIVFVGATNFSDGYHAIKEGLYWGSVYQSPVHDAEAAIKTAVKILMKESIPFFNYFDTPPITQENINEFVAPLF